MQISPSLNNRTIIMTRFKKSLVCNCEYLLSKFKVKHSNLPIIKQKIFYEYFFAIIILLTSVITVALLQNQIFELTLKNEMKLVNDNFYFCKLINFSNFNAISHSFALILLLMYVLLFRRTSCCLNLCFGKPALPMILSPFKKENRKLTAIVYGMLSIEVYKVVKTAIVQSSLSDAIAYILNDPTGLLSFILRLVEVFLIAVRNYPLLVAFHSKSKFVHFTSALFIWIDLAANIHEQGKAYHYCPTISLNYFLFF